MLREALPPTALAALPEQDLAQSCAGLRTGLASGEWPYNIIRGAAGLGGTLPEDDVELWLRSAAALIAPLEETGLDPEDEARLYTLEHGDWLGAVAGLARAGVGASAEPEDLVRYIDECPEVEGAPYDVDEELFLTVAFEVILPTWEAVGAVDADRRLMPLGAWGLPRALALAWGGELDAEAG